MRHCNIRHAGRFAKPLDVGHVVCEVRQRVCQELTEKNGAEAEGGALRGVGAGETIGPNGVAEVGVRTRQRRELNAVC